MQAVLSFLKNYENALLKLLPLMAFALPLLWLYLLDAGSFELMWKGRTFQIFFMWLIVLELILGWDSIQPSHTTRLFSAKTIAFIAALLLPTVYVVIANYLGLNTVISEASRQSGVVWWDSMTLSTEYLVFTVLFCVIVFLQFGKKGLKHFYVPAIFLGIVGVLYTIDNVFPYGQFTPFQLLVPTTANLAASMLNLLGYQTSLATTGTMPRLTVTDPANSMRTATFDIAWPCAGIESLLIFTVVVLLFIKRMQIGKKAKLSYFAIGIAVTYSINILRIVTIFTIGMNNGDVQLFHFYYGPLYSITWIISYPLLILGSQILWRKITIKNSPKAMKSQQPQPNHG